MGKRVGPWQLDDRDKNVTSPLFFRTIVKGEGRRSAKRVGSGVPVPRAKNQDSHSPPEFLDGTCFWVTSGTKRGNGTRHVIGAFNGIKAAASTKEMLAKR